ncbi:type III pantothenate kinase [Candidatus Pelagibacter sp.]|nr:type III pantothenate kinase [Candidatus Pelagibacter sp.]
MIILGDIGNTETKICLVNNNKIVKRIIFPSNVKKMNILNKYFKKFKFSKLKKILFCSVVPSTYKELKKYFLKKTNVKCFELKELDLRSILKIDVNYKQVGSDRLANAISVSAKNKNFIILDFGTATTFDVLIGNNYKGGVISPGINLSLNTLSDKASLIPKINLKQMSKVIGKDTKSAVRSGFFWGYAGLIDNVINLIKKETKKSFKVIITGGFSKLFKSSIKTKTKQDFDITINGLKKASKLIK